MLSFGVRDSLAGQHQAQIVALGTCQMSSGGILLDCRVGYRTFGRLNADRSNAVLIPTWLGGKSNEWAPLLGPNAFVDTTTYYAIVVDALGNGVSSSPSNSASFPSLSIADMVESQYRLVREHLRLPALHAVVGVSMGGMQVFEWAVRHPDFVSRFVSISGSPRLGAYDRLAWSSLLSTIGMARRYGIPSDSAWLQFARIRQLVRATPAAINTLGPGVWESTAAMAHRLANMEFDNWAAQVRAMLDHDSYRTLGRDTVLALRKIGPRMLIAYSWDDHVVTAGPASEFARLSGTDTIAVRSPCGHDMDECAMADLGPVIRHFLAARRR